MWKYQMDNMGGCSSIKPGQINPLATEQAKKKAANISAAKASNNVAKRGT